MKGRDRYKYVDCMAQSYIRQFRMKVGALFAICNCLAMVLSRCMAQKEYTGDLCADDRQTDIVYPLHISMG